MRENKITYEEILEAIAAKTNQTRDLTDDFIKETVHAINAGLERDGSVRIAKLGIFELREMAEREGINPQTGETIIIPAHTRVAFKPSASLSRDVNRKYRKLSPSFLAGKPAGSTSQHVYQESGGSYGRYGIAALVLLILAVFLFIFLPDRDVQEIPGTPQAEQGIEAESSEYPDKFAANDESEKQSQPTTDSQEQTAAESSDDISGETADQTVVEHSVRKGDRLWDMSDAYYKNPFFWPNIYRVNTEKISNPDMILVGMDISVPPLLGSPDKLTSEDSANISLGYIKAYAQYKAAGEKGATQYLVVSQEFNSDILEETGIEVVAEDLAVARNAR